MSSTPSDESDIKKAAGNLGASDPVTPKLRSNSNRSTSSFDSPRSPLFSKEDQIEIQQNRRKLEMEIITLDHKLKSLQTEFQNLNSKLVSHGELTQLKAQTRLKIFDDQNTQANQLIDDYIETIQSVRAAQAAIIVLEQKIQEESERRKIIIDESNSVLNALDFSDMKFTSPKLTDVDDKLDKSVKIDMDRLRIDIQNTQNSISSLENSHQFLPIQTSVANEMKKSFESDISLRSIGTAAIRSEIQANQKLIATNDSEIRKFEMEINEMKANMDRIKKNIQTENISHETQLNIATTSFKQQMAQLDTDLEFLKTKLSDTALIYDKIAEETKMMETKFQNFSSEENPEEDMDETESEYPIDYSTNYNSLQSSSQPDDNTELILTARKKELENEVSELSSKFKEMKKDALKRENFLKQTILKLNNRFKENRDILIHSGFNFAISPSSPSGSGITKSLDNLIIRIDNSLSELNLSSK
ncbi:hypothetical protein TVAG_320170 [Trichomonas vaginalis G3]|uniref:Uncharacterized protein n=1 Tax=Trichomonas vaginalis (strain ATCC PRA-98 / G3) TaxID=412133 RepID=A2DQG5_TRIV3|nr:hypothetical protein TVAGG3_1010060 [Trichomonas vaginalis G3]EAY17422.1 hypothetical protein TVAG_320170 [Trichomonas vaginalis G3]KAI5491434.1 hypothetical protein TVAGG3_1010060 [Trichomonas vaginalis G3]|eukprot:XP_001330791.1 hypothetical protein [Trichomonas vaginalis G3]